MIIGIDASRANIRERTGTEQYSFQIIRHLTARDRTNRFILYVKEKPLDDLLNLGPHVSIRVLRWPPRFLWSQLRLSFEMLVRRPDVLFVPAHTIPLFHPRNTVTTIHDLGFERNIDLYGRQTIGGRGLRGMLLNIVARILTLGRYGGTELDYHRWSARFAARHARHLITVSEFSKREIIERYHVETTRISAIYHGFEPETYQRPSPSSIDRTLFVHSLRPPYVYFIGRLERKKNILALVRAFAAAHALMPDLSLVLIGKIGLGWEEAAAFIAQHGLEDSVRVLGWQPDDVVTPIIAGADALVFLSEYEGFGLPVLESFAIGTPVIAATRGSIPEISGDAALLVDPHDPGAVSRAICDLHTDTTLKHTLVARGHERTKAFSWDIAAQKTHAILIGRQ